MTYGLGRPPHPHRVCNEQFYQCDDQQNSHRICLRNALRLFPSPHDIAKLEVDVPAVSDYIQRIQDNVALARDRRAEAKTKQTTYANKTRRQEPDYKIGDKVYLESKNVRLRIKKRGRSAKFYPRYIGPFEISKAEPKTSN